MNDIRKIPLAERIRGISKAGIPLALSMTARDFLDVTGEITGQEARYEMLYQTHIAPHDRVAGTGKRVCELIVDADVMEPEDWDNLLFWLLIEPFVNMEDMERRQEP